MARRRQRVLLLASRLSPLSDVSVAMAVVGLGAARQPIRVQSTIVRVLFLFDGNSLIKRDNIYLKRKKKRKGDDCALSLRFLTRVMGLVPILLGGFQLLARFSLL